MDIILFSHPVAVAEQGTEGIRRPSVFWDQKRKDNPAMT